MKQCLVLAQILAIYASPEPLVVQQTLQDASKLQPAGCYLKTCQDQAPKDCIGNKQRTLVQKDLFAKKACHEQDSLCND